MAIIRLDEYFLRIIMLQFVTLGHSQSKSQPLWISCEFFSPPSFDLILINRLG